MWWLRWRWNSKVPIVSITDVLVQFRSCPGFKKRMKPGDNIRTAFEFIETYTERRKKSSSVYCVLLESIWRWSLNIELSVCVCNFTVWRSAGVALRIWNWLSLLTSWPKSNLTDYRLLPRPQEGWIHWQLSFSNWIYSQLFHTNASSI